MNSAPTSPTSRGVQQQQYTRHIHQRTLSTSHRITLPTVPTTPPSKRAYRLVPDSPTTRRARKQVLRSKHRAREWVEDHLGKDVTLQRVALWICVAGGALIVLVQVLLRSDVLVRFGTRVFEAEQDTFALGKGAGAVPKDPLVVAEPPSAEVDDPLPARPKAPPLRRPIYAPRPAPPPPPPKDDLVYVKVEQPPPEPVAEPAGRYLLVAWMGEQETKAQSHLYNLGLLAISLNRTLVLPQVRRSRFGTCYGNDFSLYYDRDSLASFDIPYITHQNFLAYTKQDKHKAPTAQLVAMSRGNPVPDDLAIMPLDRFCLGSTRLDFATHSSRAFFSPSNDYKSDEVRHQFGEKVVRTLLEDEESDQGSPDVIVMQYNLRYSLLSPALASYFAPTRPTPAPYSYFRYSPHWTTLGQQMASSLSPYIAVHWRTETLPVSALSTCASALIRRLAELKKQYPNVTKVYLAMDYPIEGLQGGSGDAHSGTLNKMLTPEHHVAMRRFLDEFEEHFGASAEEDERLELTSFVKEQSKVQLSREMMQMLGKGKVDFQELDGAIVGIVDKIVLMKAEVFIAGASSSSSSTNGKCGKNSQFTEQVVAGRTAVWAEQEKGGKGKSSAVGQLWNSAGHFAMDSKNDD